MKRYKKCNSGEGSLIDFQAWNEGDTQELQKWINWSYERHYFVNKNGVIDLFYEEKDGEEFYEIIIEKLKEELFFDSLCNDYLDNVEKVEEIILKEFLSKQEIIELHNLIVKCWPAASIFDLISNWPEISDDKIKEKVTAIRREKSESLYKASDKILKSISKLFPEINSFENFIIIQEFEMERFPPREELEKRKKHYILFSHYLETDQSFKELAKKNDFEISEEDISEIIKGSVAVAGNVLGRVKIVFKQEDLEKVNERDILVAPMTTPDHIIAMEKASAFVTDEGGIMCHAAIIAREFGKPCIVGTGNATKVLKDNDLVFVNGNTGVVEKVLNNT